eukprot:8925419-Alexandrium_andersonii.AAC.1
MSSRPVRKQQQRGRGGSCSGCATRGTACGSQAPAFAGPWRHACGTTARSWSASRDRLSAPGTRDRARNARTSPAFTAT